MGKYEEEKYPQWFIFGENSKTGMVDINDGKSDIATCSKEQALLLIEAHNKTLDSLYEALDALNDCKQGRGNEYTASDTYDRLMGYK